MSDSAIEPAKTGRSKCRGCRAAIEKGELRLGILSFQFDSEGSWMWYHLKCGAEANFESFENAVSDFEGEIPNLDELREVGELAAKKSRFPRVEESPSGRASCQACGEKIAPKGALRVVVQRETEGPQGNPITRAAYLHLPCAKDTVTVADDLLETLLANSILDDAQTAEVRAALAGS